MHINRNTWALKKKVRVERDGTVRHVLRESKRLYLVERLYTSTLSQYFPSLQMANISLNIKCESNPYLN